MDSQQATQIKQGQRAVWDAGEFKVVAEFIVDVGKDIVATTGVSAGDTVLDVACGTGNAAIPAARAGAMVTGLDIVPKLLSQGREAAESEGLEITWVEGDAEELPFEDGAFGVVLSTFGCMFAPRHRVAAGEIARVLAPGGRIGICSWRPAGAIGKFFGVIRSHMPPPPPDAEPPPLWGDEDHVRALFEGTGVEPEFDRRVVDMKFESPEAALEKYVTYFGPLVMARAALEPEGKWDALEDDLRSYFAEYAQERDGQAVLSGDYLAVTGVKD